MFVKYSMNRIPKKIFKIFMYVLLSVFILIAAIFIFIQTDIFNKIALDYAVENLNEGLKEKNSRINVRSLTGNIFTGLRMDSGSIVTEQDTLLKFNFIDLKYNIWGLLDQRILLDHIIISSPVINLKKVKDSTDNLIWNFSRLFSSPEESDTSTSAFDWDIAVNKFKIKNGFIRTMGKINDTVLFVQENIQSVNDVFDPENFLASDLNMELDGMYFRDSKKINLKDLSFKSNSGFSINKFALEADIDIKDSKTAVSGLVLETERSKMFINTAVLSEFNPFDSTAFENFREKELDADIYIENINFRDVSFFLPDLNLPDSTAGLILKAKGKYGDIDISELKLTLPNSLIDIKGKLRNLDEPDNIYLDLTVKDLDVLTGDIKNLFTSSDIDLTPLGRVTGNLTFKGTFDKFYSRYEIYTGSGNANGFIDLNMKEELYSGKINTANINIGKFLKNKDLASNLNLNADFSGKSFGLNKMHSSVNYSIRNSSVSGYDIRNSAGKIYFANNNIDLNISHSSSAGNIRLSGKVNISNVKNPVYSLKGKAQHLNISAFTKNSEDKSDLNFSFNIKGRGIDLKDINGKYDLDIENSYFAGNNIPQTPLNIEINNTGGYSSYILSSDIVDFTAKGNFDIGSLSNVVSNNIGMISDMFKDKLFPDSAFFINADALAYNIAEFDQNNFDVQYTLISKDTSVLNPVLKPFGISFNGNISGNVLNENSRFSLTTLADIKNFSYNDTLIVLNNFSSDIRFTNDLKSTGQYDPLSSPEIKLNSHGEKIILSNSVFDSVKINIDMTNSVADLMVRGIQDSGASAFIKGKIDLTGSELTASFDSVSVNYGYITVANDKDWIVNYLPGEKISLRQFGVKSGDMIANILGDYLFYGSSDVKLEAKNLPLDGIYSLLSQTDTSKIIEEKEYPVKGMINSLLLDFKGTITEPELKAEVTTGPLKHANIDEEQDIGDIKIKVDYKNESAAADIILSNAGNKGNLKIRGDIPFRNPLVSKDSLIESDLAGKSVDVKLSAEDFQLKYFLKLIPSLPDISGRMNGEINASGDALSPDLKGSVNINDGEVYFALTGMNYKYKLNTSADNSKLVINKLSLSSSGDEARHFDISGNIDFSGMKINDIDLNTSGDMVFLDKDVDQNELGVYGYFRAGSGTPAIKINGNLDKLSITGQLLVIDATISSVPLEGTGYDNKTDNFTYITVSDTSESYSNDTLKITELNDYYKINPFARYKYSIEGKERTAADFLDMDINVLTQKSIYVSIDFDNITKDRLFGEINADLNLKTEDREFKVNGDVNIVNNSYYRFYKDFKLKDSKISFNGDISNPLLDIQAVYEGVRNIQQFGTVSSTPVNVKLTLKGELDNPEIDLKLIEDGTAVSGSDAQADAITFLLFGKYKSELSTTERTSVASSLGTSLGSLYISSIVSQTVRDILPFLIDAQFKYSEGNVTDTEVEFTSELGEATIKVGGKLLKEIRNFEFVIDYPLNNFLNLNLPETLLMEFSREEENNVIFGSSETTTNTGLKIAYRIKY